MSVDLHATGTKPSKPPKSPSRNSYSTGASDDAQLESLREISSSSFSNQSDESSLVSSIVAEEAEVSQYVGEEAVEAEGKQEEIEDNVEADEEDDDEYEAALGPLEPSSSSYSSSSSSSSTSPSFSASSSPPAAAFQVKRETFVLNKDKHTSTTTTTATTASATTKTATMSASSSAFFANKALRGSVADGARADRMKMAQAALAELGNSVELESKYEAAHTDLTSEEVAERSFRKMALFGTRAERVAQERKAAADAAEAQRQEIERQKKEQERALIVLQENTQKRRSLDAMEGQRAQRQAEKSEELDVSLRPLPSDWANKEYNLPVADQKYWVDSASVYFCMDCKLQFLSGSNPLTSRQRCVSCGQLYCASCCPVVGYSTLRKDLGKFRACKPCVQTTIAVADRLKHRGDKNDQLRRVIAEKVEAGGDHCLVIGCQENHRQHYCKYCKSKDATHFSFKCAKAPKSPKR